MRNLLYLLPHILSNYFIITSRKFDSNIYAARKSAAVSVKVIAAVVPSVFCLVLMLIFVMDKWMYYTHAFIL